MEDERCPISMRFWDGFPRCRSRPRSVGAVGKTDDSLRVAVRTGVIAIPLSEIVDLRRGETLSSGSQAVEVDVAHPEKIVQVLKVRPIAPGERIDPAVYSSPAGFSLTGERTTETATLTGRPLAQDQTDDGPGSPIVDDSAVLEF
jgi:hypothetical protein